jgi:TRAP-type C4-dicarboxylate transport system substrate-binding protein
MGWLLFETYKETCMKSLRLTATLLPLALSAGLAMAQGTPMELKYSSAAPPTSPWAKQITRNAAEVDAETKGALKLVPFFNSQLGSENDVIAQVSRGRIDMGSFTAASAALQVPEISLLNLPFFFDNQAQRDCVLDKHAAAPTAEAFAKKGLHFVNWVEVGSTHLPGKKPYVTRADIKGIKVGVVTNKMTTEFWQAMGANPVPTAVAEVSSSMQTGLIDTYPAPYAFYMPSGLNKIAPVMTKFPLWEAVGVLLINKGTFDKMPADVRAGLVRGIAKNPPSTLRAEIRGVDAALTKAHIAAGGTVVETTPEQRGEWSKDLPPIWKEIAKDLGSDGEKYFAMMVAGKQACAAAK